MQIDPVEATLCDRMRALAHKGGAATKRRFGYDPHYYRDIGRLGGHASVAARKAKIAAELDGVNPGEAPIVEPVAASSEAPQTPPRPAQRLYKKLLPDRGRPSPYITPPRNRWDAFFEEQNARLIAQMGQQDSEDWDEPFDELTHR
jgi:hypothetical protein